MKTATKVEVIHKESGKILTIDCFQSHIVDTLRVSCHSFREQCKAQGIEYTIARVSNHNTLAERLLADQFTVNSTIVCLQVIDETFCGHNETLQSEWFTNDKKANNWFYYITDKHWNI